MCSQKEEHGILSVDFRVDSVREVLEVLSVDSTASQMRVMISSCEQPKTITQHSQRGFVLRVDSVCEVLEVLSVASSASQMRVVISSCVQPKGGEQP